MEERKEPKVWKMTILVWIAIVPLVFTVLPSLGKFLTELNFGYVLRELIVTTVLVLLMSFVCLPILNHIFKKWLDK